jgi:hypothetical protein
MHACSSKDKVLEQKKPDSYTTRGFTGTGIGMGVQGRMGAVVGMSTAAAQAMQLPQLAQPLVVMKMRQWCRWVGTGQRCGRRTGVGLAAA